MNFYSNFIDKLHFNLKPLFGLLPDNLKFHRNNELGTLFEQIKTTITKDVTRTLPNTNSPFFLTVDSPFFGIGCILFQMNDKGKLNILFIPFSSF